MFKSAEILGLIHKDYLLDLKSKNIILSTLLYVFSTVFVCYLSFQNIKTDAWNSLFWIIALFAITNAANKVFLNESGFQKFYLYTLADPRSIILSKLVYQWIFTTIIAILVLFSWMMVFSIDVPHILAFLVFVLLGIWSLSNVLTLNNALSTGTSNSPAVLAILSFPIMLPILMTTIKATKLSLMQTLPPDIWQYGVSLLLLNVLTAIMAYILFPYLWRY